MPRVLVLAGVLLLGVLIAPAAGAGDTNGGNTSVSGSTNSDGGSVTVSHPGSTGGSGGTSGSTGNSPPIVCRYYELATGEGSTSARYPGD